MWEEGSLPGFVRLVFQITQMQKLQEKHPSSRDGDDKVDLEQSRPPMNQSFYDDDPLYKAFFLVYALLHFTLGVITAYVGLVYEGDCSVPVPRFLLVGGVAAIAASAAKGLQSAAACMCRRFSAAHDYQCLTVRPWLFFAVELGVLVWGSALVLPMWETWTPDPGYRGEDSYCAETPYLLAFSVVVFNWCVMPAQCCACCCFIAAGFVKSCLNVSAKLQMAGVGAL